jgi:hypothetical protein
VSIATGPKRIKIQQKESSISALATTPIIVIRYIMPNIKLIAVTITAISISTIVILSSQQSAQDKVLSHVFSLHANSTGSSSSSHRRNLNGLDLSFSPEWMGGGLPSMGDGPWNDGGDNDNGMLQLFSSTPNNPRQYTGGDTEYIHYKNVSEKDGYGHTTFPPSQSPTMLTMMLGGGTDKPTPYPSNGGEWTREPSSRSPTKLPETTVRDDDDDDYEYEYDDDEEKTKRPTKKPSRKPTRDPTLEPTLEPTPDPSPKPSRRPTKLPTREPVSIYLFLDWY